jgi:anti-sigma B factor antagonist
MQDSRGSMGRQVVVGLRLKIDVELLDEDVVLVRVLGEIDMSTTPALVDRAVHAAETGPARMVVDLSETEFMGAAGLHVLEQLQDTLRLRGGDLAVVSPGGIPRRVFDVTGTAAVFGVADSLEAARDRLR